MDIAEAVGSPARAGIDRWAAGIVAYSTGFPRTRGVRPSPPGFVVEEWEVPPHARG